MSGRRVKAIKTWAAHKYAEIFSETDRIGARRLQRKPNLRGRRTFYRWTKRFWNRNGRVPTNREIATA